MESSTRHRKKRVTLKTPMEFSKKLMVFATTMYALTWLVAVVSWFMFQEFPGDLKEYTTWLYGEVFAFYSAKACIENKAKIEGEQEGEQV